MSQITSQEAPQLHQIDLTKLNIAQLTQLKQQLDQVWQTNLKLLTNVQKTIVLMQELNLFQDSLQSLKIAQVKFQNSGESLEKVTPESKGKSILVPLTGSVSFFIIYNC